MSREFRKCKSSSSAFARKRSESKAKSLVWPCESLEHRLLLATDVAVQEGQTIASWTTEASSSQGELQDAAPARPGNAIVDHCNSIVFIDSEVTDWQHLATVLEPEAELHLIPHNTDAIALIGKVLASREGLQSLHIVSHGRAGILRLGGRDISAMSFQNASQDVAMWRTAFAPGADILLYGCDVGVGTSGEPLLDRLKSLTGCDVAASVNRTGHARHQGDWQLETQLGAIESRLAFMGPHCPIINIVCRL
jgi:hypothetical protein